MYKTTAEVSGMMCGMCEAHVSDAIRRDFNVKKVKASRKKKNAVIISEEPISREALFNTIDPTGYELGEVKCEPYNKKGIFG